MASTGESKNTFRWQDLGTSAEQALAFAFSAGLHEIIDSAETVQGVFKVHDKGWWKSVGSALPNLSYDAMKLPNNPIFNSSGVSIEIPLKDLYIHLVDLARKEPAAHSTHADILSRFAYLYALCISKVVELYNDGDYPKAAKQAQQIVNSLPQNGVSAYIDELGFLEDSISGTVGSLSAGIKSAKIDEELVEKLIRFRSAFNKFIILLENTLLWASTYETSTDNVIRTVCLRSKSVKQAYHTLHDQLKVPLLWSILLDLRHDVHLTLEFGAIMTSAALTIDAYAEQERLLSGVESVRRLKGPNEEKSSDNVPTFESKTSKDEVKVGYQSVNQAVEAVLALGIYDERDRKRNNTTLWSAVSTAVARNRKPATKANIWHLSGQLLEMITALKTIQTEIQSKINDEFSKKNVEEAAALLGKRCKGANKVGNFLRGHDLTQHPRLAEAVQRRFIKNSRSSSNLLTHNRNSAVEEVDENLESDSDTQVIPAVQKSMRTARKALLFIDPKPHQTDQGAYLAFSSLASAGTIGTYLALFVTHIDLSGPLALAFGVLAILSTVVAAIEGGRMYQFRKNHHSHEFRASDRWIPVQAADGASQDPALLSQGAAEVTDFNHVGDRIPKLAFAIMLIAFATECSLLAQHVLPSFGAESNLALLLWMAISAFVVMFYVGRYIASMEIENYVFNATHQYVLSGASSSIGDADTTQAPKQVV